jgi:hypothetical protein
MNAARGEVTPGPDCTWILGLPGLRVVTTDEADRGRLRIRIERRGVHRYPCSGCGQLKLDPCGPERRVDLIEAERT